MRSMGRVAVLAGGGKTGRAVLRALEAAEVTAYPVGRPGPQGLTAHLTDRLAGCDAVYLVAPNLHPDEPGHVGAVLQAAVDAGVGRVVYHSVAAPYAPDMPHHLGKAQAEDVVRRSGLAWTLLQPCAYVQNFVPALRGPEPVLEVAYDPDRRFGLVDLDDVAQAAAKVLTEPARHEGATYELGGPALVSVPDVAAAASAVLGTPVPVRRVSPEAWDSGPGSGLDPRERAWLQAMFAYYDRHGLPAGPLPLQALLGREPTSLAHTLARELRNPHA